MSSPSEILSRVGIPDDAIDVLDKLADDDWRASCPDRPTVGDLVGLLAETPEQLGEIRAMFAPSAALVTHGLVFLSEGEFTPHDQREVRIDDRTREFMRGGIAIDHRIASLVRLHDIAPACDPDACYRIVRALGTEGPIVVDGPAQVGKVSATVAAISETGPALVCDLNVLVTCENPSSRLKLVWREAMLAEARLVLRAQEWEASWSAALRRELLELVERGAVLVIRDGVAIARDLRGARRITVAMPSAQDQTEIWTAALGELEGIETVPGRYPLPPGDILIAAAELRAEAQLSSRELGVEDVLAAARTRLGHRLGDVAELVSTKLAWSDVVLRDDIAAKVRELIDAVRMRDRVLTEWGFESKLPYGRSVSALLSGPPGTGKTMVATVMGKELGLEVFRVDLSKVVSKYIGETEKNLARVFDEATRCRAILLFDEADSLFSKRTEVRTSNDKNSNLEVNFLLQRLETHDGVVVLTTNAATAIDRAFLRRIAFRIEFSEPDAGERSRLWRSMIPATAPLADDVDFDALGRTFAMTGGHIKNAVVRAAYRAVTSGKAAIDHQTLMSSGLAEWTELGNLMPPMGMTIPEPAPVVEAPPVAPRGSAPTITRMEVVPKPVAKPVAMTVEAKLTSILSSSLRIGETIESGYRRKESELADVLGTLSVIEARALHRRLEICAPSDVLAQQFSRLTRERRQRLLAFLSDVRRRQAIRAAV